MDTQRKNGDASPSDLITPGTTMMPIQAETMLTSHNDMTPVPDSEKREQQAKTPLQESLQRLRRDVRAMISIGVILLFIILPIIGPLIYRHIGGTYQSATLGPIGPSVYHDPFHQELTRQDEGPSAQYWLGTDSIGRDLLARLMQGMLVSLLVAALVEVVNVGLGICIGVLAGFYGGWLDQFLARFTDVMFAFPGLLFAILLSGIFGPRADQVFSSIPLIGANGNARLVIVSFALALVSWPFMARLVRGQTLQLKEQQFIEAARTVGTSNIRIILRHILPNLFSIVVVAATLDIASTIIGEAGLSFLGLGVQSPGASIGLMISDASNFVELYPWEVLLPSITLTIIVLAFSFLGDGLRDAFDPRSKD